MDPETIKNVGEDSEAIEGESAYLSLYDLTRHGRQIVESIEAAQTE